MVTNEKEKLITLLNGLNEKQISALKIVVESMASKEREKQELYNILKISEPAFEEWDNTEDDVY